jgi:hypothetical protein
MAKGSDYDGDVQMFVQRSREVDLAHLRFLRWLAVRGCLEHDPLGRSCGVYALDDVVSTHVDPSRRDTASAHSERSE